jgi:hypothetical protein
MLDLLGGGRDCDAVEVAREGSIQQVYAAADAAGRTYIQIGPSWRSATGLVTGTMNAFDRQPTLIACVRLAITGRRAGPQLHGVG